MRVFCTDMIIILQHHHYHITHKIAVWIMAIALTSNDVKSVQNG